MRALVATGNPDDPVAVGEAPEPVPTHAQLVVEVEAVSLNRGECRRARTATPGWIPGWDVAGTVAREAADGTGPPAGTRVVGLASAGGWADRVALDADRVAPLPDSMDAAVAATLPVAGMTALLALRRYGSLLGARVAVTGATGGVGMFALQLARLAGARTTAVVSAPDRAEGLPEVGAIEVGLAADGPELDLVLESVGGPLLADALARLRPGGLVVTYGGTSTEPTTFDVSTFYGPGKRLEGFLLFTELAGDPPGGRHLTTLADLVVAGRLQVGASVERPWTEGPATVRDLLARRIPGKAVLRG